MRIQSRKHIKDESRGAGLPHAKIPTIWSCHAHANVFVESLTNCAQILKRMTHNEGAIRSLYPTQQCCFRHLQAKHVLIPPRPDVRADGMISGLPAHRNVSTFPPLLSTAHLRRNLSVAISGVAMCDAGRGVFRCLGLNPEQTCILLLNGSMCVCACVCVYLLSLMIFSCCMSSSGNNHVFGIKTCFCCNNLPGARQSL